MKKNILFLFSVITLLSYSNAQTATVVSKVDFFANPSKYDNQLISINNAFLRPRVEVAKNCKSVDKGERPITVEFKNKEFNNKVCFSIAQPEKKKLIDLTTGPTKATIVIKGTAQNGFTIISYVPDAPLQNNSKDVTEAAFMANPASFNGTTFTLKNVSLRPRQEVKAECKRVPVGERPITVEFASAPKWNAVCFSIDEDDKDDLKETKGPTKANITLKGNADKGFRIVSFVVL